MFSIIAVYLKYFVYPSLRTNPPFSPKHLPIILYIIPFHLQSLSSALYTLFFIIDGLSQKTRASYPSSADSSTKNIFSGGSHKLNRLIFDFIINVEKAFWEGAEKSPNMES